MPPQQQTKDIIYSWIDKAGTTHYANDKAPISEEPTHSEKNLHTSTTISTSSPLAPPVHPANPINLIAHNSSTVIVFFMLLMVILLARLILDEKSKNKTRKSGWKAFIINMQQPTFIIGTTPRYNNQRPEAPDFIDIDIEQEEPVVSEKTSQVESRKSWSVEFIKSLEWHEFEKLCARMLQEKGFRAELGEFSRDGDGGIDIHIWRQEEPATFYGIAQCKAQDKDIEVKKVRELRGTMAVNEIKRLFFTSGKFSKIAWLFCKKEKIEMITGKDLLRDIKNLSKDKQNSMLAEIVSTDYKTPTCSNCGIKMIRRTNVVGKGFWSCKNFPKCRNKLPFRWTDRE